MIFLIVFASVFGIGLSALFPMGFTRKVDASQFPKYLAMVKADLHGLKATVDIFIASGTTQVQSFT